MLLTSQFRPDRPAHSAERSDPPPYHEPTGKPGAVRLDALGVDVAADAVVGGHLADGVAVEQFAQPLDPPVAVVLLTPPRVMHKIVCRVGVPGRVDADPGEHAPARERVSGAQILGEAERVLVSHRDHGTAQAEPLGVLRHGRKEHGGRGQPVLQVAGAHPAAVEAQLLRVAEQFDALTQPLSGIVAIERDEVDEAEVLEGSSRFCMGGHWGLLLVMRVCYV